MAQNNSLFSVEGLVAIVTGGGTGLGRTMALALDAHHAAKVFVLGRRESLLQETTAAAVNHSIVAIPTDITSKDSLAAAFKQIAAHTDHVDLVIANSGVVGPPRIIPGKPTPTLEEFQQYHWDIPPGKMSRVLDVNVMGTFYTILAFLPLLKQANERRSAPRENQLAPPHPQVIIISSIGGMLNYPGSFAYAFSKAALLRMVPVMAASLAPYQIRVNGIAPGLFWSEMAAPLFKIMGVKGKGIEEGAVDGAHIPVRRTGAPQDLAGLVVWMAGASGGFLNGESIVLDGGRSKVSL